MADDISELIVKAVHAISDIAVHSEESKKGTGLELESAILELIRIERNSKSLQKAIEDTKALHLATPSATRANPDYNPTSALKGLVYEKYDDADKKSKHYEFFRKELVKVGVPAPRSTTKRAAANDDDDVEVAEVELDVICPISRVVMTNPVKNPHCGHSYSRAAAEEYHRKQMKTKKNAHIVCPIAGCTALLDVSGFTVDQDMEYAILAHKSKRQNTNDDDKYEAI